MKKLEDYVISIPDFPEPGILFRDVTSVLQDAEGFRMAVDSLLEVLKDTEFDAVLAVESRGFIFGAPLAYHLGKSLVLARKPGKLPRERVAVEYELEYGTDSLEMHRDAVKPGQKVVIIDDLLATGGTAGAAAKLVESLGGQVAKICFVIELKGLNGREKLSAYEVESIIAYEGK